MFNISRKEIKISGDGQDFTINILENENPYFAEDKFSISIEDEDGMDIEFTSDDAKEIIKSLREAIHFIEVQLKR